MDNGSINIDESRCDICDKQTNYTNYFIYYKDCYHATVYCEKCLNKQIKGVVNGFKN